MSASAGFDLEPADLVADGDRVAGLAHGAQFLDLGLQFGHRLFEVEIGAHVVPVSGDDAKRQVTQAKRFKSSNRVKMAFTRGLR